MKIKICFFVFFICNLHEAKAQIQGTINYQCTIDDKVMPPNTVNYMIYFNSTKSIEFGVKTSIKSGKIDENSDLVVTDDKALFILKDFKSRKIILADYLGYKPRLISDTLPDFNWTITKEKRKVSNFHCTKALTNFRGRNYIAWFTDDIPIQNGPWKFHGLPGLIVTINDDKQIFSYEITGINLKAKFNDHIIAIPKDYAKDKAITQKVFITQYNKKAADNTKMSRVVQAGKDGSYGTATVLLPEKQEKF